MSRAFDSTRKCSAVCPESQARSTLASLSRRDLSSAADTRSLLHARLSAVEPSNVRQLTSQLSATFTII
jgi:hypothetical protein